MIIKNDGLGDVLLFLPYLQKIREIYPEQEWKLSVAVLPGIYPVVKRARIADKIICYPKYRNSIQWSLFRLLFWLGNPMDIAVNAGAVRDEVLSCCPVEKKVSVYLGNAGNPGKNAINVRGMTIRQWNQTVLKALDITEEPHSLDYTIFCDPIPEQWIAEPYILICPEANDPGRRWETEKFSALIDRLTGKFPHKIILTGTDPETGEKIIQNCKQKASIGNFCGKTSLFELFTLVRHAGILVSNDTGTAHIGAALQTTTFIICGKGHYGVFVPYPPLLEGHHVFSIFSKSDCKDCLWANAREECKQGTYRCISEISVDDVWNQIIKAANMQTLLDQKTK